MSTIRSLHNSSNESNNISSNATHDMTTATTSSAGMIATATQRMNDNTSGVSQVEDVIDTEGSKSEMMPSSSSSASPSQPPLLPTRMIEGECSSVSVRERGRTTTATATSAPPPVSEHEEEEGNEEEDDEEGFDATRCRGSVSWDSNPTNNGNIVEELSCNHSPTKIPCEEREQDEEEEQQEQEEAEEESDYEYDYSDEEDCHLSFLSPVSASTAAASSSKTTAVSATTSTTTTEIPRDEDQSSSSTTTAPRHSSSSSLPTTSTKSESKRSSWKEPSREAVSMSLRAERETTGGKRRLASDLYKIMMGDTEEQGFSLEPSSEDSLEKWKIKLFDFDKDSNLHKDLMLLGVDHVELEMSFPDQYPFEAPFVRVVKPRFQKQTGFVMNGALCMELLTNQGWNPVNDIESVIVSIRSLIVVGGGRLAAAVNLQMRKESESAAVPDDKKEGESSSSSTKKRLSDGIDNKKDAKKPKIVDVGKYTASEARAAYSHLSAYHAKKGWDSNGWWAKMG